MMRRNPFDTHSPFRGLELARRKRIITGAANFLLLVAVPILTPFTIMFLTIPGWQTAYILSFSSLSVPISLAARRFARHNQPDRGSALLVIHMLLLITSNGILIEGLFPAVAPAYTSFIVLAGMTLGPRGGYGAGVLSAILWASSAYIIDQDMIRQVSLDPFLLGALVAVIIMAGLIMIAFLAQMATTDLRRALNDATYDLVQTNRKLEAASEHKSQFMARTSHELRTPLSAIIVFTDLTLRKAYGPVTEKQEEGLKRVLANAKRLTSLINDLLDLAKIEAGEMEISEEPFLLQEMVDTVQSTLEADVQDKGLDFNIAIGAEMPKEIIGDENRLCQVLLNLTHNAVKFTDEGSIQVTIAAIDKRRWKMQVTDTGEGIPDRDLKRIFDEFQQVGRPVTDSKTRGTGLGLAITRHLVQLMGGTIQVESEHGKGSTFEVTLPLRKS